MDDLGLFATLAIMVVATVGGVVTMILRFRRAAQRRDTFAVLAADRGWQFRASDSTLNDRFRGAPFGVGHSERATNVVFGHHDGRAFTTFDHRYSEGHEEHTVSYDHSVMAMHLGMTSPHLEVIPRHDVESSQNAIEKLLRMPDEPEPSDVTTGEPPFDESFLVKTSSPQFARDVLSPELRLLLWQNQYYSWRFEGDSMLVVRPGVQDIEEIDAKLRFMDGLLDAVPQFVWDKLRGEQR